MVESALGPKDEEGYLHSDVRQWVGDNEGTPDGLARIDEGCRNRLPIAAAITVAALCERPWQTILVPRAISPGSRAPTQPGRFYLNISPVSASNTAGWLLSRRRST